MSRKSGIDFDEWQAALRHSAQQQADKVPPGWRTLTELKESVPMFQRVGRRTILYHLRNLIRAGNAEAKEFRIFAANSGQLRQISHYRLTIRLKHGAADTGAGRKMVCGSHKRRSRAMLRLRAGASHPVSSH
jgi:hypothetical protein